MGSTNLEISEKTALLSSDVAVAAAAAVTPPRERSDAPDFVAEALGTVLISVSALSVLAFGGTESVSFAIAEMTLFTALLIAVAVRPLPPWQPRVFAVPLGLLALVLLQLTPLPRGVLRLLGRDPGTLVSGSFAPMSIAPSETLSYFLLLLTYVSVYFLAWEAGRSRGVRRRILYGLIALAGFEAVYGLYQYLTGTEQIFKYARVYAQGAASGTYLNRNHYAGLLEMILPLAVALGLSHFRPGNGGGAKSPRGLVRWLGRSEASKCLLWLTVSGLLLLALFFSFSRMGILAAACSMLWVFAVMAKQWLTPRAGIALAAIFVLMGGGLILWVGPDPVLTRFGDIQQEASLTGENRVAIWGDTLNLIRQQPWLGTGYGTFPIAYTATQTVFLNRYVNRAHNDYLELASDLGIPAACVIFGAFAALAMTTARRLPAIRGPFDRALALGSTGSIVAILVHSFADFNLYIPANALVFCLILGLAQSLRPAGATREGARQ